MTKSLNKSLQSCHSHSGGDEDLKNAGFGIPSGRGKWGKVSHLFSWLRGGETVKIELFINLDCESFSFCEQISGKIKTTF